MRMKRARVETVGGCCAEGLALQREMVSLGAAPDKAPLCGVLPSLLPAANAWFLDDGASAAQHCAAARVLTTAADTLGPAVAFARGGLAGLLQAAVHRRPSPASAAVLAAVAAAMCSQPSLLRDRPSRATLVELWKVVVQRWPRGCERTTTCVGGAMDCAPCGMERAFAAAAAKALFALCEEWGGGGGLSCCPQHARRELAAKVCDPRVLVFDKRPLLPLVAMLPGEPPLVAVPLLCQALREAGTASVAERRAVAGLVSRVLQRCPPAALDEFVECGGLDALEEEAVRVTAATAACVAPLTTLLLRVSGGGTGVTACALSAPVCAQAAAVASKIAVGDAPGVVASAAARPECAGHVRGLVAFVFAAHRAAAANRVPTHSLLHATMGPLLQLAAAPAGDRVARAIVAFLAAAACVVRAVMDRSGTLGVQLRRVVLRAFQRDQVAPRSEQDPAKTLVAAAVLACRIALSSEEAGAVFGTPDGSASSESPATRLAVALAGGLGSAEAVGSVASILFDVLVFSYGEQRRRLLPALRKLLRPTVAKLATPAFPTTWGRHALVYLFNELFPEFGLDEDRTEGALPLPGDLDGGRYSSQQLQLLAAMHAAAGELPAAAPPQGLDADECCVCWSAPPKQRWVRCAACRKAIHNACVLQWLKSSGSQACPMCKAAMMGRKCELPVQEPDDMDVAALLA